MSALAGQLAVELNKRQTFSKESIAELKPYIKSIVLLLEAQTKLTHAHTAAEQATKTQDPNSLRGRRRRPGWSDERLRKYYLAKAEKSALPTESVPKMSPENENAAHSGAGGPIA